MTPSRCRLPSASAYPMGSVKSYSVWNMVLSRVLRRPFQPLAAHRQCIDGHVVALGIHLRRRILAGPGAEEVPPHLFRAQIVLQDDGAVLALDLPIHGRQVNAKGNDVAIDE